MLMPRPRSRPAEALTGSPLNASQSQWLDARSTGSALGVSEKTLSRWRKAGLLKAGIHWRRKFPSPNSPVLYQLELCCQAMSEATARCAALLET
jgi:hypothetical protein